MPEFSMRIFLPLLSYQFSKGQPTETRIICWGIVEGDLEWPSAVSEKIVAAGREHLKKAAMQGKIADGARCWPGLRDFL